MEAKKSKTVTLEMLFEELKIMRSQMEEFRSDFENFKNPVGEFTSKWVDTYDGHANAPRQPQNHG
jgi:hypothetical protein